MDRLTEEVNRLLDHAEKAHMTLAFEPEPGMFVDTLERFGQLDGADSPPAFSIDPRSRPCPLLE